MSKITVTHYLNKRLKPSFIKKEIAYPVYLRVSNGRKNERIKSDWIVHKCSEYDFENHKDIVGLKEYEAEIIQDIFLIAGDREFDLSARLGHSKTDITQVFQGYMFEKREITEQVISYISRKADIRDSILSSYVREELKYYEWKELCDKRVFNEKTTEKVLYLSMLLEFEELKYPFSFDEHFEFGYKAGCIFVFHEWKNKNKEQEFLEFAEMKDFLPVGKVKDITNTFNDMLLEFSTFDIRNVSLK